MVLSASKGIGFTGKVYPDGSYGYSRIRRTDKVGTEDYRYKYLRAKSELEGLYTRDEYRNAIRNRVEWNERSALGSSMVPISHTEKKPRAKRGSKGLTSHGRRIVFGAASFLEWRCGRRNMSFLTLTLPDFSPEHNELVASKWSELIRQFTQWIRRRLHDKDVFNWVASATEVQNKRHKRTGCVALHQHFVFVGRSPKGGWAITPREVRQAWMAIVSKQLPVFSDSNFDASENLQMVRRSVSGYLAKYLTKGVPHMGDVDASPAIASPPSWYACTRALRKILHASTRASGDAISSVLNASGEESYYHRSVRAVVSDGLEIIVGAFGKFKPGWSRFVPAPIHPSVPLAVAPSICGSVPKKHHDGFSYMF